MKYNKLIVAKIKEHFPGIGDTITSKQIRDFVAQTGTKGTGFLFKNKISRGIFSLLPPIEQPKVAPVQEGSNIPYLNDAFVPFGVYEDMLPIIKSKKYFPVYITGPSGVGKGEAVEQICAQLQRPLIRINLNSMVDEDKLIGSKTLIDNNIQVVYGPVLIAMKKGYTLLLDEIDAANPNTIMCLQGILEGKPYYFALANEWINPEKGFTIVATGNTKGKGSDTGEWIGTHTLNEAFLERFKITMEQTYPPPDVEKEILVNVVKKNGLDHTNTRIVTFCSNLVQWANIIRVTHEQGGVTEVISTRRLIHIIDTYSIYKHEEKSIKLALNRFDQSVKDSFFDFYTKVAGVAKSAEGKTQPKMKKMTSGVV